jgi:alpha-mannosidase
MDEKRYADFHVRTPVGRYSGSERQDPTSLEEPDNDKEFTRTMYLDEMPDDPDFQEEIGTIMRQKLDIVKQASNVDPDILHIHAVGQSHIDVAWKWRYEQTRKKAAVTFRKAVYHAGRFPNFRFALSQPQLLQWILEDDPELFAQIQDTVAKGGIELVGGSWVEPDCMMPSGEAMCRTRLYGQKFYRDYFGKLAITEWYTDSFGYSWNLPQIVAKSGGQYFFTSKITWNRQTVFPFVNFWWESPDGSRIITCNFNMDMGVLDNWLKYEPGHRPLKVGVEYRGDYSRDYYDIEDFVDEDEVIPAIGYFKGQGDGGHGPNSLEVATMNEQVRQGYAKWSTVKDFFDEVAQWQDRLPVWRDEQYLEYHRGTFTVHPEVKRHNRLYENALVAADNLAAMLSILVPDYARPSALIEDMWKVILCNQFHDVLPGSSIPEVYDDVNDDWDAFDAALPWIYGEATSALTVSAGTTLLLYNPAPVARKGPVFIPAEMLPQLAGEYISLSSLGSKPGAFLGQPAESEPEWWVGRRGAGWWAVVNLEPLSVTPFEVSAAEGDLPDAIAASAADAPFANNGIVQIEIDFVSGAITKLTSQLIPDVDNVLQGTECNLTVAYLDDYPNDHAWNIKPEYWKYPIEMRNDEDVEIKLVAQGPVFATLEVARTLGEAKSKVWQRITLMAGCPEVFLELPHAEGGVRHGDRRRHVHGGRGLSRHCESSSAD